MSESHEPEASRGAAGSAREPGRPVHLRRRRTTALALRLAPDRLGKVAVIEVTGDEMPVQVRDHVAEAGQVDLLGAVAFAQRNLDRHQDVEAVALFGRRQVTHLGDVLVPDQAAVAGVIRIVDTNHPAACVVPEHRLANRKTQGAIFGSARRHGGLALDLGITGDSSPVGSQILVGDLV